MKAIKAETEEQQLKVLELLEQRRLPLAGGAIANRIYLHALTPSTKRISISEFTKAQKN